MSTTILRSAITTFFLFCFLNANLFANDALEQQAKIHSEAHQVISVPFTEMPTLQGLSHNDISLWVCDAGNQYRQVPLQVIDLDNKARMEFAIDRIGFKNPKNRLGKINAEDTILMMMKDLTSCNQHHLTQDASFRYQFKVQTAYGERLAFLRVMPVKPIVILQDADSKLSQTLAQSEQTAVAPELLPQYTQFDFQQYKMTTPFYKLSFNPENPFEWTRFQYHSYRDQTKETLVDALKFRISGELLGNVASLNLTNDNLKTRIVDQQVGPIAVSLLMKTQVSLAKIPVAEIWLTMTHFPSHITARSQTRTLKIVPYLFRNISLSLMLDANDLRGSEVFTALRWQEPGVVDGNTSPIELSLQKNGIDKDHNWIVLRSPENFQIMTQLWTSQFNKDVKLSLIYRDDLRFRDPPEYYPGQLPMVGYQLSNIPLDGIYDMGIELFFDNYEKPYSIPTFAKNRTDSIPVKVLPIKQLVP